MITGPGLRISLAKLPPWMIVDRRSAVPSQIKSTPVGPLPPHRLLRDWLPAHHHATLLEWVLSEEARFEPTTVVSGDREVVAPEHRLSSRLPKFGPLKGTFVERVWETMPLLFEGAGTRPFEPGRVEVEIAAHNDGAHFFAHTDIPIGNRRRDLAGKTTYDRVVSAVYYFHSEPKAFSGGELRIHRFGGDGEPGQYVDIVPENNSLLVFPAWATHEVLRVSCPSRHFADSRFAVNCWLHRRNV